MDEGLIEFKTPGHNGNRKQVRVGGAKAEEQKLTEEE